MKEIILSPVPQNTITLDTLLATNEAPEVYNIIAIGRTTHHTYLIGNNNGRYQIIDNTGDIVSERPSLRLLIEGNIKNYTFIII
jgi:hypothetical protein